MSKIFRLYNGGNSTYQGWSDCGTFPYNSANREKIDNPDGASAKNEITSIPSPFARIDLVKTAFKEVCKPCRATGKVDLNGKTIFHKMVSDSLDVGEIFFNIEKYKGKINILKWDAKQMIDELSESECDGHRYFADALSKYLQSDAATYNFDRLGCIYLLNDLNGPDELNIIGATSPSTLFFCNANDLSFVTDIHFNQDCPFDNDYQPLYNRDFEYVKYLFSLRKNIQNFTSLFPEIDNYLSETYKAIKDEGKKRAIQNLTAESINDYPRISITGNGQNDYVEALNAICLRQRTNNITTTDCSFLIQSSIQKTDKTLPLVLPIESGSRYSELQYISGKWGKTNAAPPYEKEPDLSKRTLPFDGSTYPYLTISDFLEDDIICVPYKLNKECFFNGNANEESASSFLLPIKPLLFKYFTVEELTGEMPNGTKMIEMQTLAGGSAKVILRIPIKGTNDIKYIEYTRNYYKDSSHDISKNKGGVVKFDFSGFVMPMVRFNNTTKAIYNAACIKGVSKKYEFTFYRNDSQIQCDFNGYRGEEGVGGSINSKNYLITQNFDYIRIADANSHGLIIPLFKGQRETENFEFAVDLGTSNTHIEYKKSDTQTVLPFSFTKADRQLCEMFIPPFDDKGNPIELIDDNHLTEVDFIPQEIGNEDFRFPTRTVLSYAKMTDWNNDISPYTLFNLPFTYDKRETLSYNNYHCNIKWGQDNEIRILESYIRCLSLIIRNKVILNNGNLQNTKIKWFYPISMPPRRLDRMKAIWDKAYQEYFGNGQTSNATESSAPIQYYFERYATATSLVNVDIGGGTTDIAFANNREINLVTSFRFASNALFENQLSNGDRTNGIIDFYKGDILQVLNAKNISELCDLFNSDNNASPSNMASFLFSLKDNKLVKANNIAPSSVDFNHILRYDEKFKIVFILFYTAIIYHIAQIIKAKGMETPRHISFSGNGSKVVATITSNLETLSAYTKAIFEHVTEKPYGKELEILGLGNDSNPKEATCKGGIIGNADNGNDRGKIAVFKGDTSGFVNRDDTYESVTETYKKNVVKEVEKFFDFALNTMNSKFKFDDYFGVEKTSLEQAKILCKGDLDTFLNRGIALAEKEFDKTDTIQETFFFYPVKGVMQALSNKIFTLNSKKQ